MNKASSRADPTSPNSPIRGPQGTILGVSLDSSHHVHELPQAFQPQLHEAKLETAGNENLTSAFQVDARIKQASFGRQVDDRNQSETMSVYEGRERPEDDFRKELERLQIATIYSLVEQVISVPLFRRPICCGSIRSISYLYLRTDRRCEWS